MVPVTAAVRMEKCATMGLKVFKVGGEREALGIECDDPVHGDEERMAWFDCGSHSNNLTVAIAAGWLERRGDRTSVWFCPPCAHRKARKRT
jgi:hypothetical protein